MSLTWGGQHLRALLLWVLHARAFMRAFALSGEEVMTCISFQPTCLCVSMRGMFSELCPLSPARCSRFFGTCRGCAIHTLSRQLTCSADSQPSDTSSSACCVHGLELVREDDKDRVKRDERHNKSRKKKKEAHKNTHTLPVPILSAWFFRRRSAVCVRVFPPRSHPAACYHAPLPLGVPRGILPPPPRPLLTRQKRWRGEKIRQRAAPVPREQQPRPCSDRNVNQNHGCLCGNAATAGTARAKKQKQQK